jgi:ribosome-associated translation inhibitor RaiA
MTTHFTADVPVHTRGAVTSDEAAYARARIEAVLRYARDPVLFVRVQLTRLADPALSRPAVAQVNLDLNGRLVRAQVARPTMREAVDEVHDRLRDRLQRATGDWEAIRGARPSDQPHEWRHGSVPTERPSYFPRPVEERQVVRHKAFSLAEMTVDEAAFDLAMLDYSFHLFTEVGSGVDSVLYRTDDGVGLRLAQVDPRPDDVVYGSTPVTVSTQPAPELTVQEATERLTVTGWPFVLFRDATNGRGCVLYHRYDGHYGLITPAD